MSVGEERPVCAEGNLPLSRKSGKKVVVSRNHLHRTSGDLPDIIFTALHVPQMDEKVDPTDLRQHLAQIPVLPVGVAYHQDPHHLSPNFLLSVSFMARRALPL